MSERNRPYVDIMSLHPGPNFQMLKQLDLLLIVGYFRKVNMMN